MVAVRLPLTMHFGQLELIYLDDTVYASVLLSGVATLFKDGYILSFGALKHCGLLGWDGTHLERDLYFHRIRRNVHNFRESEHST